MGVIRLLLLADSHLGLDLLARPRVARRARGEDFFANYQRALEPARRGGVDLVVHGGDVFSRSRVCRAVVARALEPLLAIAESGIPVFVVPGNHERSALPFPILAAHPHLHVFDRPRTVALECAGKRLAVSGFPYARQVREHFVSLVKQTGWRGYDAEVRLLVMHQCLEGARVGLPEHTFRNAPDVVRARDVPTGFAAVLSGHIHRVQRLTHGLDGRRMPAPVIYPGSLERTSIAECRERKGFVTSSLEPSAAGGRILDVRFHPLPTRPMYVVDTSASRDPTASVLRERLARLPADAIVRVRLPPGTPPAEATGWTRFVRDLAPPTMSLDVRPAGGWRRGFP